jgi:hypothetical protein
MKSYKLNETESTLRVYLTGPGPELAPVFDSLVTIPGSSGISVEQAASIRVPPESKPEVLSLLAKAGWTMLVLALLMLPARAFAFCDDWRTSDTVLATTYTALLYQDWRMTKQFIGTSKATETSPLLSKHPSGTQIDAAAISSLAGAVVIGCFLDGTPRAVWFSFLSGVEFQADQVGWGLGFHGAF